MIRNSKNTKSYCLISHLVEHENKHWQKLFEFGKKLFSQNKQFRQVFNTNTLSINYSCMSNISSFNLSLNRNLLGPKETIKPVTVVFKIMVEEG